MKTPLHTSSLALRNTWTRRGSHEPRALRLTGEPLPATQDAGPATLPAFLAPAMPRRIARNKIAATVAALAAEGTQCAANYRAAHLLDTAPDHKPESALKADCALRALFPARGETFRRVRALCRKTPRRAAAIIAQERFADFSRRIAGIIIHRMEHGNPRKAASRMGRAASLRARMVRLSRCDKEDMTQEITAALWAGNWHGWEAMDFPGWRRAYGAARRAIRARTREEMGGDSLIAAADGPADFMAGLRQDEENRAARLRLLIRAALAAYKADTGRKRNATFRARLADIRAIARRGGYADCVDTVQDGSTREAKSALAAALSMHAARFAKYIQAGLVILAKERLPEREFRSFEDMALALA